MNLLALAILIGLEVLILLSLWILVYQMIQQQGRILLRLDAMEKQLAGGELGGEPDPGLEVGAEVGAFRHRDIEGREVDSEGLKGKRTLLVHWNPDCGFCEDLAPELARRQGDLRAAGVQLVLASQASNEANRELAGEHGLTCPILVVGEESPLVEETFRHQGTPVAYLLDERGRVARPLAVGGEAILALAEEAVGKPRGRVRLPGEKPLSQSRLVRDGLKAGTPAPPFRLPDLDGGTVALEDYRGRPVLLVFTDPDCGPCEELAPQLARRHRQLGEGGPAILMVGRGDAEANRQKARKYGLEFPVVLQDRWKLSKEYGIFEVPVAFLIGEDGVIARNVARGVDEILDLVPLRPVAGRT